jgi:phage gp36-like protein
MAFITSDDYKDSIQDGILNEIIEGSGALLTSTELKAQAEITSYLAMRYDVPNIFNKTGAERHPLIIMYMVDITLYHLHSRINPGQVPQLREARYVEAKRWLEMVAAGKLKPDLPVVDEGEDGVNDQANLKYGGLTPRDPYY